MHFAGEERTFLPCLLLQNHFYMQKNKIITSKKVPFYNLVIEIVLMTQVSSEEYPLKHFFFYTPRRGSI